MTVEFLWTIPTSGDGRDAPASQRRRGDWNPDRQARFDPSVRDERPGRFTYYDYLTQVARAAEASGFDGLYVPYDPVGEDAWIIAAALARETPRLTLLPEFQPGFGTAVYTAKLALSFQRFFQDRLRWKLALDGAPEVQETLGDFVASAERLARAEEFVTVTNGVWNEAGYTFRGEYFDVVGGGFFDPGVFESFLGHKIEARPHPKLYLDGSSDAEVEFSARHADVHVFHAGDPAALADAISNHRGRADAQDREVQYGLHLSLIARDTAAEAHRRADRLWDQIGSGQSGTNALDRQGFDRLGFSAPAGLVGSFDEITERLHEYVRLGVSSFILDGAPRLEEAYRLGQRVLSRIDRRDRAVASAP